MLAFCLQSLFREYGWSFIWHVVLPHPVKTIRTLIQYTRVDFAEVPTAVTLEKPESVLNGPRSVVGVGFCLKPIDPPCPSGRFNHDCQYLERSFPAGAEKIPNCCRYCAIREIGEKAFYAGFSFYIMTSAKDILHDLYLPSLRNSRFTSGVFVLCRYSFEPFATGMLVSGIRGWLLPFEQGDCRDYKTWVRADRGDKTDQTVIADQNRKTVMRILDGLPKKQVPQGRYKREGNILGSPPN